MKVITIATYLKLVSEVKADALTIKARTITAAHHREQKIGKTRVGSCICPKIRVTY